MKTIEIDLYERKDLLSKYNKKNISKELIEYIIENAIHIEKQEKIVVNITNYIKENIDSIEIIKKGLKEEYNKQRKLYLERSKIQLIYFIFGIIILFISTLIKIEVLREVILICGWVLIWAMVEMEIFSDTRGKKIRKTLKRVLNSEIKENNIRM